MNEYSTILNILHVLQYLSKASLNNYWAAGNNCHVEVQSHKSVLVHMDREGLFWGVNHPTIYGKQTKIVHTFSNCSRLKCGYQVFD